VKEQHLVGVAHAKNGKKGNETGLIHLHLANHLIEFSKIIVLVWLIIKKVRNAMGLAHCPASILHFANHLILISVALLSF
jgi:hypothetical protein